MVLKTGKLVLTPQFTECESSRQLEIVNLHTPTQSLIRYFKKRAEVCRSAEKPSINLLTINGWEKETKSRR